MEKNQIASPVVAPKQFLRISVTEAADILRKHRAPDRIAPVFAELTALLVVEMIGYPKKPDINYQRIRELGEAFNSLDADEKEGWKIMSAAHFTMKEHYRMVIPPFLVGH